MQVYFTNDDWILEGTVSKPDGSPLDLTGATISIAVRNEFGTQLGTTQNGVIVSAQLGTWSCVIPRAMTSLLLPTYVNFILQVEQNLLRQEFRLETALVNQGIIV